MKVITGRPPLLTTINTLPTEEKRKVWQHLQDKHPATADLLKNDTCLRQMQRDLDALGIDYKLMIDSKLVSDL